MIDFFKFHGAGNDFIIINAFSDRWNRSGTFIKRICDCHYGVGGDGLIYVSLCNEDSDADIKMEFFNNDGCRASMCGNGLRCVALFAYKYLLNQKELRIKTDAGVLCAKILSDNEVEIELSILELPRKFELDGKNVFFSNTGVPHLLVIADEDIKNIDIQKEGAYWRYHKTFSPEGVNVNFISEGFDTEKEIKIRTYERGVEDETCACGTGIAAVALSLYTFFDVQPPFKFLTPHNDRLTVDFCNNSTRLLLDKKINLTGPAVEVFHGVLNKKYFAAYAKGDR